MKAKAAELGGNALFRPDARGAIAYAVWVAPAQGVSNPGHEQLLGSEARALEGQGFQKQGPLETRALGDAAAPIEIELVPGTCYAVTLALSDDAVLDARTLRYLGLAMNSNDPLMQSRGDAMKEEFVSPQGFEFTAPYDGPYVRQRAMTMNLGCAERRGRAHVVANSGRRQPLMGRGRYFVQVYTHKISGAELARKQKQMAEARRQAMESQRRFEAEQRAERAERERREQERREQEARVASARSPSGSGNGSSSATSSHFSFNLKNECRQTVKLVLNDGRDPKFHANLNTSMSANSIRSFSGNGSQTYWIVDDSGRAVSSFTAGPNQRDMRILDSCTGFAPRI